MKVEMHEQTETDEVAHHEQDVPYIYARIRKDNTHSRPYLYFNPEMIWAGGEAHIFRPVITTLPDGSDVINYRTVTRGRNAENWTWCTDWLEDIKTLHIMRHLLWKEFIRKHLEEDEG
jgi:hypothetical protein